MSDTPCYMDLALDGYVMPDEIDDFVETWHESDSELDVHDFLGLTFQEYSLWVAHPDNINIVIAARLERKPVLEAVNDNLRYENRLAARADDVGKLALLQKWIDAQSDR